jgi:hypothetical protein
VDHHQDADDCGEYQDGCHVSFSTTLSPNQLAPGFEATAAPECLDPSKRRATRTTALMGRNRKACRGKSEDFRFSRLLQKPWRRDAVYEQFAVDRMMNSQTADRGVTFAK